MLWTSSYRRGFLFTGGGELIELVGVSKVFRGESEVVALDNVSLHIPRGVIFGIIGLSGAGKSTLIRCINGLETPDAGEVIVDGVNMNQLTPQQLREERKKIGMIFQHFNLLSSRTAAGNIAFPLELVGMDKNAIKIRVAQMLELVGLADKAGAYPHQLSGGQKQRVGIARALANQPQVLLSDEATSALDPETTLSVLQLLKQINQDMGLTIVLITHEMGVIQSICDYVAVIDQGKIVETGPVIDVFTRPQSSSTKRLIQGSLDAQIPEELLQRIKAHTDNRHVLLKLNFIGELTHKPVISSLLRSCEVEANILFGKIDQIKDIPFGMLLLEITGEPDQIQKALKFMRNLDVEMEVISNG
jgi:D-methionine transport system ATP-binding protein